MKLTLTYVGRFTKKKDGTPLMGKNGRPYTSIRIKANEYGDRYLSGFDGPETRDLKEGDTVEADVEEKGEYLNFSVPKKQGAQAGISEVQWNQLNAKLDAIWTRLGLIQGALIPPKPKEAVPGVPYPEHQGPPSFDGPSESDFPEIA